MATMVEDASNKKYFKIVLIDSDKNTHEYQNGIDCDELIKTYLKGIPDTFTEKNLAGKTFYFIRHGASYHNPREPIGSSTETESKYYYPRIYIANSQLTQLGAEQAKKLYSKIIPELDPDFDKNFFVSSPLDRAIETLLHATTSEDDKNYSHIKEKFNIMRKMFDDAVFDKLGIKRSHTDELAAETTPVAAEATAAAAEEEEESTAEEKEEEATAVATAAAAAEEEEEEEEESTAEATAAEATAAEEEEESTAVAEKSNKTTELEEYLNNYANIGEDVKKVFICSHQGILKQLFKPIKIKDNGITKQLAFINCSCLKLEISERGESNAEILFAPYDENNKYTMKPKYYYLSV